jgi:cytochrome b involved in lipid metabolism
MAELLTNWSHDIRQKLYVKIDSHWFDLTLYRAHPGGYSILKRYHLKDATEAFNEVKGHCDTFVDSMMREYIVTDKLLVAYLNSASLSTPE